MADCPEATLDDVPEVARVCTEAFAIQQTGSSAERPAVFSALEASLNAYLEGAVRKQLLQALTAKQQASSEAREWRLRQQAGRLRAELSQLRGQRALFPALPTPLEWREVERWRGRRRVAYFVAVDARGALAGCAFLSFTKPEAMLPPPFPSSSPVRCYVANMAVAPGFRRRGAATALLRSCARLATLWGQDSLWLHVDADNAAALRLYDAAGFSLHLEDGGWRVDAPALAPQMTRGLTAILDVSVPWDDQHLRALADVLAQCPLPQKSSTLVADAQAAMAGRWLGCLGPGHRLLPAHPEGPRTCFV
ncbi:hypothetical protein WJX81_000957 [Elliptochloris bilobata]|uniref:N-acetyltransferase domain-containing protein n=1 Tax=Elliptochloris bilobata TaxID=381761 RepID=A0AAW1RNA0_9CHLO